MLAAVGLAYKTIRDFQRRENGPGSRRSVRQFDSVRVFLVALVLFSKHLLQPRCLFFGNLLIHDRGLVTDDELLAATVLPVAERFHFAQQG